MQRHRLPGKLGRYAAWSFLCGTLASVAMGVITPIAMSAEMLGTIDYRFLLVIPITPAFLVAVFLVKVKGTVPGALCGLSFSLPIGLVAIVISAVMSPYDPRGKHAGELLFVAVASLGISVSILSFRAWLRDD